MYPSCGITCPIHREITVPSSMAEPTSDAAPIAATPAALSPGPTRPVSPTQRSPAGTFRYPSLQCHRPRPRDNPQGPGIPARLLLGGVLRLTGRITASSADDPQEWIGEQDA